MDLSQKNIPSARMQSSFIHKLEERSLNQQFLLLNFLLQFLWKDFSLYDPEGVTRNLRSAVTLVLTLYRFLGRSSPNFIFSWSVKTVKHTSSSVPFAFKVLGDLELNESRILMSTFVTLYAHISDTKRSAVRYGSNGALWRPLYENPIC